ncbi:MAG: type II secretion system F family protein [Candidatus Aenigmatarchaeota archaeon]
MRYVYEILSIIAGCVIIGINFLFLSKIFPSISPLINLIGGLVAVVPPAYLFYIKFAEQKEIEEQFIIFIKDLTECINSGMTLPIALKHLEKRDYAALTPYVRSLSAQVDWGVPFKEALQTFANRTGQIQIKRAASTIIQTYKMGGKIGDTLSAVSESLITINKIKKERSLAVHSQIVTNYLIFFTFVFILVILKIFLIPLMSPEQIPGMLTLPQQAGIAIYEQAFINFIIIQGFFAGLATGKMAEGTVKAGLKHSILLIAFGYSIFAMVSQLQIKLI